MSNEYFLQADAILHWFPIQEDSGLAAPVVRPFSWAFSTVEFPPGSSDLGSPRREFSLANGGQLGGFPDAQGLGDVDVNAWIEIGVDDTHRHFFASVRLAMGKAYRVESFALRPGIRLPFMLNVGAKDPRLGSFSSKRLLGTACSLHGVFTTSLTGIVISTAQQ